MFKLEDLASLTEGQFKKRQAGRDLAAGALQDTAW